MFLEIILDISNTFIIGYSFYCIVIFEVEWRGVIHRQCFTFNKNFVNHCF